MAESRTDIRPRAFSIAQAATILAISPVSVRRLIGRGLLRPNRTLRHIRITEAEINRFLAR
jgi:excisionase family DNA binding protein